MPKQVNIYEAKTHLSALLNRVAAGEEILIARYGKPVARLTPLTPRQDRTPGAWKGRVKIADDFDRTDEQVLEDWYGGDSDTS